MPLKIVTEEERIPYVVGDATIYYRRLGLRAQQKIHSETLRNGEVDYILAAVRALEYCVVGWEGVVDAEGKPVEFRPGMGALLPQPVRDELFKLIVEGAQEQAAALEGSLKNS